MRIARNYTTKKAYYYLNFEYRGKKYERSLKTWDRQEANKKGKALYDSIVNKDWHIVRALSTHRSVCTIGDIVKLYICEYRKLEVEYNTARNNAGALRAMVLAAELKLPRFATLAERYAYADAKSATVLTADLVENFKTKKATKMKKHSLNSHLRQARSVFSKEALALYAGLTLPDISKFMNCKGWSKAGYGGGYDIIPPELLGEIDASAELQRAMNPDVHRVYLLVRKLGMRSVEVLRARTSDICEISSGKFAINIVSKKSGREEVIPRTIILSEVLVREFHKRSTDEFLIAPALAMTRRYNIIYKTTNVWLRNFLPGREKLLPGREKCLYELRKAAGSEVATADGLMATQKFLGHKRYETTEKWYAKYVDAIHALS